VIKKRILDLLLSSVLLVLFLLPMIFLCIIQKIVLGSPILFTQKRLGLNGKTFKIIKFRTMKEGSGPDEERLSSWGKLLRSTSLDELPELWNVLIGNMSLVGPRPLPEAYKDRYSDEQSKRHQVLPGISGWAQVNGRNNISWAEQFRLDCWYVENASIMLDLKILLLTIGVVLKRKNINEEDQATRSEFLGE